MSNNQNPFKKAEAVKLPIKCLVMGESGTGKTYTALQLATAIAKLEDGRVAFIDSEGGRAQFYAPYFDFDHKVVKDNSPKSYIDLIRAAEKYGYKAVVVDSFSHAWSGEGGVLEIVDKAKTGWAVGKPEHHKLVAAIHAARIHVFGTVRTKNSYEKSESGSVLWETAKVDARQEGEFEYEFDVSLVLDRYHAAAVRMSKCFTLKSGTVFEAGQHEPMIDTLYSWANAGTEPPKWFETPEAQIRLAQTKAKLLASKVPAAIADNAIVACLDYDAYLDIDDYYEQLKAKVKEIQASPYNISKIPVDSQPAMKRTGTSNNEPNF